MCKQQREQIIIFFISDANHEMNVGMHRLRAPHGAPGHTKDALFTRELSIFLQVNFCFFFIFDNVWIIPVVPAPIDVLGCVGMQYPGLG